MGTQLPEGELVSLGTHKQSSSKDVTVWALRADFEVSQFVSATIQIEWPPKSGTQIDIPENDRAEWMRLPEAQLKMFAYQVPILDALCVHLGITADAPQFVPLETVAGY